MQRVTAILDEDNVIRVPEGHVVESRMLRVTPEQQRQPATRRRRARLDEFQYSAEPTEVRARGRGRVGIAGLIKEEFAELCAGAELAILGPFEGCCLLRLCQCVRVEDD